MRWPSFLTRRPPPTPVPVDPLTRCEREISEAVARRRETRLSKAPATEAKRFARARPKVDALIREMAMERLQF